MENLPEVSFHHLPRLTTPPLLHGIGLPGPRANGHLSWLGVFLPQQITAPQLHPGCGVRTPPVWSEADPAGAAPEPREESEILLSRHLNILHLVVLGVGSTLGLACTSWLERWLCSSLDQRSSSLSWWPPCLLCCLGSAMLSLGHG